MAKKKSQPVVITSSDGLFDDLDFSKLGEAVIVRDYEPFEGLSSGSLSVDWAVGNAKGFPRGQVTQICGHRGVGKTSLYMLTSSNTIASGGKVAIIDMEYRFNVEHAYHTGMGYPGKNYMLVHPLSAEDALNYLIYFCSKGFDLVVIDSVGGMSPRKEIEGEVGDSTFAGVARVLSQFFRMRMTDIWKSNTAVIFINQFRTKIGVMYGTPDLRMGGKALEFYTSVGIDLAMPESDSFEYTNADDKKEKQNMIGFTVKGKTWKNSVCQPNRKIEMPIQFIKGVRINTVQEVKDYGAAYGVFTAGSGGKPTEGTKWVHGDTVFANVSELESELASNPEMLSFIIKQIKEEMANGTR